MNPKLYSEFDQYAKGYSGGSEDTLKRFFGKNQQVFLIPKARWLLNHLSDYPDRSVNVAKTGRLLDFGCGNGAFLQTLREMGYSGFMDGCDVSAGMVQEAIKRWGDESSTHLFMIDEKPPFPFKENSYDVITACCVFHHIKPFRHAEILKELLRALKPGGRIVIFEHNPLNPLTLLMVRRLKIDRNARLILFQAMLRKLSTQKFINIDAHFLIFFPPNWSWQWVEKVEQVLKRVPFGGQYVVAGEKPCE